MCDGQKKELTTIQQLLALADEIDLGGPAADKLRELAVAQQVELLKYKAVRIAARAYVVDAWQLDEKLTTKRYVLGTLAAELVSALKPLEGS